MWLYNQQALHVQLPSPITSDGDMPIRGDHIQEHSYQEAMRAPRFPLQEYQIPNAGGGFVQ
jgi:hypothetical protein